MALYFNDTEVVQYQDSVFLNGTEVENVYFNDTLVYTRHPYPIGTEVFTYSWSNGSNIDNFRTTYYTTYPLVFASQPSYTQGSGSPDSRLQFTLNSGFQVSYYNQSEYGTDSDGSGAGNDGGTYSLYVGNTVSGASDQTYGFSIPGSGNGGSTIKIKYIGN